MTPTQKAQTPKGFCLAVQSVLEPLANTENARAMSAYMKHHFAFLGVKSPTRIEATKPILRAQNTHILQKAQTLWALPEREYQYVASELLARNAKHLAAHDLETMLVLVTQKSWWDSVDALNKTIGVLVQRFPTLGARMDELATHPNLWLRRIAIIHQLHQNENTDLERLFRVALLNAGDPEFFVRKAIGWALREHAHHDPEIIRAFLQEHAQAFSSLTVREAKKHL